MVSDNRWLTLYSTKMADSVELQPPQEFPFPFQPYDIQERFMHALYTALENRCIGIFESPTDTVRAACGSTHSCIHLAYILTPGLRPH